MAFRIIKKHNTANLGYYIQKALQLNVLAKIMSELFMFIFYRLMNESIAISK